jgi:outer membrane protein
MVTLGLAAGCLGATGQVPFPAYGSAAPGAAVTTPVAGVAARLDLEQAVDVAAVFSPILASARAAYHIASGETEFAATPLHPVALLSGTYEANGGSYLGSTPARETALNVTQLLFDGGRTVAQIRAAKGTESSEAESYRRAYETVVFDVAQAYYAALEAHSQTLLQLQIVQQSLTQERLISAQIRAGTAARIDLETAQIPTAQARVAVVRAQGAELAADAAFASALGLQADAEVLPLDGAAALDVSTLPAGISLDYEPAVARALAERPDLLSARDAYESASESVRVARLTGAPMLEGTTGFDYSSFAPGQPWENGQFVGANLTIPILDQGDTRAQTSIAIAKEAQAQAALREAQITVESDVRQSLVQLVAARAALSQTADELRKASDVLAATQRQYRAGQTTLPLLLNAQTQSADAETDHLQALYGLRQAEQTYLYALGENDSLQGVSP